MCPQVEQRFRVFLWPQDPIVESEDCLYLNVFVPVDVSRCCVCVCVGEIYLQHQQQSFRRTMKADIWMTDERAREFI